MDRLFLLAAILVVILVWATIADAQCCLRCGRCRVPVAAPVLVPPVVVDVIPGQTIQVPVEAVIVDPAPVIAGPRGLIFPRMVVFRACPVT
jgi:hypothetical protein